MQTAIRRLASGSMLMCLALCGAACSSARPPLIVTRVEARIPPAAPLVDTPAPAPRGVTGYALIEYSQALEGALASCNLDKATLRAWATPAQGK